MESSTRKKNTMIIAGMVVLTILAFLLINFFSGPGDNPNEISGPSKQDLITEIEQLESSIVELEVVFQTMDIQNSMKEGLLEEKRDEIQRYDQQIREQTQRIEDLEARLAQARQRGDMDKAEIDRLSELLSQAKGQLNDLELEFSRQEVEFLYMENRALVQARDSLIRRPDADSLETIVGDLRAQLRDCGTSGTPTLTSDNSPQELEEAIKELTTDRQKAELVLINRSNGGDEQLSSSHKARRLRKVLAKYQITDQNIERFLNGSEMYMVVTDTDGKQITSNNNKSQIRRCGDSDCVIAGLGNFRSGDGIIFEFEPKNLNWVKGTTYLFKIYIDGTEVRRKILLAS